MPYKVKVTTSQPKNVFNAFKKPIKTVIRPAPKPAVRKVFKPPKISNTFGSKLATKSSALTVATPPSVSSGGGGGGGGGYAPSLPSNETMEATNTETPEVDEADAQKKNSGIPLWIIIAGGGVAAYFLFFR